jgi:hypothetical protein
VRVVLGALCSFLSLAARPVLDCLQAVRMTDLMLRYVHVSVTRIQFDSGVGPLRHNVQERGKCLHFAGHIARPMKTKTACSCRRGGWYITVV